MSIINQDYMTLQEVAFRLGIDRTTFGDWRSPAKQAVVKFPAPVRFQKLAFFKRAEVEKWIAANPRETWSWSKPGRKAKPRKSAA